MIYKPSTLVQNVTGKCTLIPHLQKLKSETLGLLCIKGYYLIIIGI